MQCSDLDNAAWCLFFFVFYYVIYGWPCPLLLYVIHVLRWQKIQNSVCFYLPYSFLYSSVGNCKYNYMVTMPTIGILFFWWRSLWMTPPFHFRVTHGFQAAAATRTGPLGPTFCSHESVLFLFSLTVNQLPISPPLLHSTKYIHNRNTEVSYKQT